MAPSATVCVFAPALALTVTVEAGRGEGGPDVHYHPGGQGFWVARMLVRLGEEPVLCGPVGGEAGRILRGLVPSWGVELAEVSVEADSPSILEDRRRGDLATVAETAFPALDRHATDELYGVVLDQAARAGVCVLSGLPPGLDLPADIYRRLVGDLVEAGVKVVGDLHGPSLGAALEGGPLDVLKVSDEDLAGDGIAASDEESALAALDLLHGRGARAVVLSRGAEPVLARFDDTRLRATVPRLEAVETRGSGDSMTAGLATAVGRGLDPERTLRLTCAAGAANVTRHGLGTASGDLVERLTSLIEVEELGVRA